MCADLQKALQFYKEMPNLFYDTTHQLNRLVYFEELNTELQAMSRFSIISKFTRSQKEKLIRSVNTDWIDLSLGLDIEKQVAYPQVLKPKPYAVLS
jgi:putative endonuclease